MALNMIEELQVRIEELEEKNEDLQDEIRGLKYELEEKDSEIEDWKEEVQDLKEELERISEELAKRPVVYCYRNKHGELAQHFGSGSLALWAKPEKQRPSIPELDWKIEIYTGEQS